MITSGLDLQLYLLLTWEEPAEVVQANNYYTLTTSVPTWSAGSNLAPWQLMQPFPLAPISRYCVDFSQVTAIDRATAVRAVQLIDGAVSG